MSTPFNLVAPIDFLRCTASLFTALLCIAAPANAMSLRELRTLGTQAEVGSAYVAYYLVGSMEGLIEANSQLMRNKQKPLFCIQSQSLEPQMATALYQSETTVYQDVYEADMPVELVMRNALTRAYPCLPAKTRP